jgi:hypothetical protein
MSAAVRVGLAWLAENLGKYYQVAREARIKRQPDLERVIRHVIAHFACLSSGPLGGACCDNVAP